MKYNIHPRAVSDFHFLHAVPQDALGMRMGGLSQVKQAGTWDKTSPAYEVKQDARLLMSYGHLHDGGIRTSIEVNGKEVCNSVAVYQDMMKDGAAPSGSDMMSGGHSHGGKARRDGAPGPGHIVNFTECKEMGMVKKGDKITTKVYYDFAKRPASPMPNGKEDPLMGISMTYLGIPMKAEV